MELKITLEHALWENQDGLGFRVMRVSINLFVLFWFASFNLNVLTPLIWNLGLAD